MIDDLIDFIKFAAIMMLFVALIVAAVFFGLDIYGRYQCAGYERITGIKTQWRPYDVCYIKTDRGWQRYDEYKARAVASEGLKERK